MTREGAKREMLFAKRNVVADSWIDKAYDMAIQALSEPESNWIPCSERLPEEYGNYLITTSDGDVDIGSIDPNKKSGWSACDADGFYWLRNVIAWMPLPGGYKGEQDE